MKADIAMAVFGPGVIYAVLMELGLTDASAGLAMVTLAASASVNMALTFSLERGLCANVRLENYGPHCTPSRYLRRVACDRKGLG